MVERLKDTEYDKVVDLHRVYGASVNEYLNVDRGIMELVFKCSDIEKDSAKKIRSGIRSYWKNWMGKYRES